MTVKLLLVDDEPDAEVLFRQQFRREIRDGLYTLDFALSGPLALTALPGLAAEPVILLASDIDGPGMSAYELVPRAKAIRPDMPVVMISAYDDNKSIAAAMERGVTVFTPKPIDFPKLKLDIAALAAKAKAQG